MSVEFQDLLTRLQDEHVALPIDKLTLLSDIDQPCLRLVRRAWDHIPLVRRQMLLAELRRMADERIELLFEDVNRLALEDADPVVRRQAISNLWECEDPGLVSSFSAFLSQDSDSPVRAAAAQALGSFILLGELQRIPPEAHDLAFASLLQAHASDTHPEVRMRALESMGFSSNAEVRPRIEAAYHSGDEGLCRSAVIAMGRSASSSWAPIVLPLLSSPSPALRLEAARAVGELELRQALPLLVELLEDASDPIRHAAIWSMGQLGGSEAASALEGLLATADAVETDLIEDALENLAFLDGTPDFLLHDFDDDQDSLP
jgi:HEAT repeat protein